MNKIIKHKGENLAFYNYKEPLREVENGYGFQGVLLQNVEGEKVQCHICGKLFDSLQLHLTQKHHTNTTEYKERFGLARKTALISEKERTRRKESTLRWLDSMTLEEKASIKRKAMRGYKKWRMENGWKGFPISLETKNKRGTCPDQLLQKIKDVEIDIGKTPTKIEFIDYYQSQRYVHLIYKTFGSWTKAVKMAGLIPVQQVNKGGRTGYCLEKPKYDKEILLEYLQIFYQENGRPPTETDCRRGLIPDSGLYRKHFGSFPQARIEAGIYEDVGRWS